MDLRYLCTMKTRKNNRTLTMQYLYFLLPIAYCLLPVLFFGQSARTSMDQKDTTDNIIIYGDSFLFSIHEPVGWQGDVNSAKNYNANIIFYKNKEDFQNGGALIHVLNYKKTDEEVNKDLEQDISVNKEKNHNLKQKNLEASHKNYDCFTKLIYVDKVFYNYIAYINPGSNFHNAFSVAMNIPKRTASKEELAAFKEIISSLVVFKR